MNGIKNFVGVRGRPGGRGAGMEEGRGGKIKPFFFKKKTPRIRNKVKDLHIYMGGADG